MPGRPVLTEIKRREIQAILAVGCTRATAARYVGCHPQTIRETARRDPKFARQLRQAEQLAEIGYLKNIQQAAGKAQYWRAAAWALERTHPERYATRRPGTMTLDQVRSLLNELAELVVAEVADAKTRQKIIHRVHALTESLHATTSIGSDKNAESDET